jgi:hypothetical protein
MFKVVSEEEPAPEGAYSPPMRALFAACLRRSPSSRHSAAGLLALPLLASLSPAAAQAALLRFVPAAAGGVALPLSPRGAPARPLPAPQRRPSEAAPVQAAAAAAPLVPAPTAGAQGQQVLRIRLPDGTYRSLLVRATDTARVRCRPGFCVAG